jgi:two-component system nitrogen regulation sensor histidine kinase NtrY
VLDEPGEDVWITCDARMIGQALTNILKNAGEAVGARRLASPECRAGSSRSCLGPTKTCA